MKINFIFPASKFITLFFLTNLYLNQSFATNSAISEAAGGLGIASIATQDSLTLNPATLVHLRGRFIAFTTSKNDQQLSLSDNIQESLFPGGLFFQKHDAVNLNIQSWGFTFAEFINEKWACGFNVQFKKITYFKIPYSDQQADVGCIFTPTGSLGVGLVAKNINGENEKIPVSLRVKQLNGFGLNYLFNEALRFRFDQLEQLTALGLEKVFDDFFVVRLGTELGQKSKESWNTAGLAFAGPRFHLNYAYRVASKNSEDFRHTVDFVVPF